MAVAFRDMLVQLTFIRMHLAVLSGRQCVCARRYYEAISSALALTVFFLNVTSVRTRFGSGVGRGRIGGACGDCTRGWDRGVGVWECVAPVPASRSSRAVCANLRLLRLFDLRLGEFDSVSNCEMFISLTPRCIIDVHE